MSVKRCGSGPIGMPRSSYSIPERPSQKTNHRTTVKPSLGHLEEVARDFLPARRHAYVGAPHVGAKVHPVKDRGAVC